MPLSTKHPVQGVLVAIIATSVAGVASAQEFTRPEAVSFMMPMAVDHVVELAVEDPIANGVTKAVIYRSGSLEREDVTCKGGVAESQFADLTTGYSWRISGSDDGARSLNFSAGWSKNAYLITRTSQIDHLLGETCEVWALQHQAQETYLRWREEDCLTKDGILVWQKVFYISGGLMSSAHATSIKRRPVSVSEVRVPAKALALSYYGDWTERKSQLNDEVLMEQGTGNSSLTRRLGTLSVTEEARSSSRYRIYKNSTYMVGMSHDRDGRLIRLDVGTQLRPAYSKTPFQPTKMQSILGELCQWFERAPWGGDGGVSECITSGGLVLARTSESMGGSSSVVATSKSIGNLTYTDVAPPPDLLVNGWKRSSVSSPMVAKSPRITPHQVTPTWSAVPSIELQLQNYPVRARADEVEGVVTLNCILTIAGRVQSCDVVSENPEGYGFGEATAELFKAYARVEPEGYQAGDTAHATLRWRLP